MALPTSHSGFVWIGLALVATLPGVLLRATDLRLGTVSDTFLFGVAIVAAAFLLSWTAEAAEMDIPQGLAVAAVALIAILPEYAVDMAFAWKAGTDATFAPYAVANMTGANRLLVGGAWSLIFLIFWWRTRRPVLVLERAQAVEVVALAAATVYAFVIPFKGTISLVDSVVLGALFIGYVRVIARSPSEAPELMGPARLLGELPRGRRRAALVALFGGAAGAVFASAEPFAGGLIHTGTALGVDQFLLVQWLAPLASEAPEFLVAGIMAYRGRANVAMRTLLSSTVNQWTLLIGGLAVAYALSSGGLAGLPLDVRQREELWLTAAQSAFGVAILCSLTLSISEVLTLAGLFLLQFILPFEGVRLVLTAVYLAAGLFLAVRRRGDLRRVWEDASTASHADSLSLHQETSAVISHREGH